MKRLYGYEGERFVAYFWFVGWWAFSLGLHVDAKSPNVEFHMPFGFLRIGRPSKPQEVVWIKGDLVQPCGESVGIPRWEGMSVEEVCADINHLFDDNPAR